MHIDELLGKPWPEHAVADTLQLVRENSDGTRSYADLAGDTELLIGTDGVVCTIFLRPPNALLDRLGIDADWTRKEVLAAFGEPTRGGGGTTHPILGRYGGWDRYDTPARNTHIEYTQSGDGIALVTLMAGAGRGSESG